jgi:hypothetical protein
MPPSSSPPPSHRHLPRRCPRRLATSGCRRPRTATQHPPSRRRVAARTAARTTARTAACAETCTAACTAHIAACAAAGAAARTAARTAACAPRTGRRHCSVLGINIRTANTRTRMQRTKSRPAPVQSAVSSHYSLLILDAVEIWSVVSRNSPWRLDIRQKGTLCRNHRFGPFHQPRRVSGDGTPLSHAYPVGTVHIDHQQSIGPVSEPSRHLTNTE